MFALAALIVLGQALPSPQGPIYSNPALLGPDFGTLRVDYEWPYTGSLESICTSDPECVLACGVGLATGSSTAWECIDHTGAGSGTVTNPGTATVIDSFIARADGTFYKAVDITAASQAPDVVSTALDAIYGQVPSTTVMVGYGRATGALNGNNWWLDGYPGGVVGYMQIVYDDTGATEGSQGMWCATAATPLSGADSKARDAWSLVTCRTDGINGGGATKHIDVGLVSQTATQGQRRDMQAGTHYIFGADRARTDMLNGPVAAFFAFNTNKSDAALRAIEDKIWRSYNAAGKVTPVQAQTVRTDWLDHAAPAGVTGNADPMWTLAPMIEVLGLRTSRAHVNTWGVDAIDATTWANVGTPGVNPHTSSGPYAASKKISDCYEIVDDDPAAFEGKQGLETWDAGTPTKNFTNSCFFKAGRNDGGTPTLTKARLTWSTDGTSSNASCDLTGLTSTATRMSCTSLFSGAVTTIKPRVLVGNAVSDTGSIQVCGCFNTEGPGLEPPRPDGTAVPDFYYTLDPAADSWPNFASVGGMVEIVHTPMFDPNAPSVQPVSGDPDYLLDIDNVGDADHSTGLVPGYQGDGNLLGIFRNAGTVSDILVTGQMLVAGHTYASATAWVPVGGGKCKLYVLHNDCGSTPASSCRATVIVGSDTTGTATCPATPTGAHVGNRFSNTVGTSTRVNALRVRSK